MGETREHTRYLADDAAAAELDNQAAALAAAGSGAAAESNRTDAELVRAVGAIRAARPTRRGRFPGDASSGRIPRVGIVFFLLLAVVVLIVVGSAVLGLVLELLWWALVGLLIGALARLVLPGPRGLGLIQTALFGVAGALLGGVVAEAFDVGGVIGFLIAILVSAVLIALFQSQERRSRTAA